jgi:peptide-methionine (R)-S-oxide reductase
MVDKITHTDEEWRKLLTPEEYHMLREEGTEPPFHNKYHDNKKKGIYTCAGCGLDLFSSDTKFDSGTGWPSFWAPISKDSVTTKTDTSYGMVREEVKCARCGGHLGHVFNDGPRPTGKRYCMNSGAMHFVEGKKG